jgi:hypothetical protein
VQHGDAEVLDCDDDARQGKRPDSGGRRRLGRSVCPPLLRLDALHFRRIPSVCHLCYDGVAHEHGGQTPGREGTGWTLSRSWIR